MTSADKIFKNKKAGFVVKTTYTALIIIYTLIINTIDVPRL